MIYNKSDKNISNNKKRLFCLACDNYELYDDFKLCFKYTNKIYKDNYKKRNNRHLNKKENEFTLRIIPNVKIAINLIELIHIEVNHQGYSKYKRKIENIVFIIKELDMT